jgi:FkbM family methyltransferase
MPDGRRGDLIIDVGLHTGEDTAFYLAKGFNVAAVEANPDLVSAAEARFAPEIERGRLRLFGVAIAERRATMPLAVADEATVWSSLSPEFVARNEQTSGTRYRYVDVPTVPFADILDEVGIPYYLKIDIEGFDMLCVKALHRFDAKPKFVSIESSATATQASSAAVFDELAELWTLGYRDFKYVNQRRHPERRSPRPPGEGDYVDATFTMESSGPFGEETPGAWMPLARALGWAQLLRLHHGVAGLGGRWSCSAPALAYTRLRKRLGIYAGWYDLHARLAS